MAFILPRRLKDLPKLELDSEDESKYTPRKSNNGAPMQKENDTDDKKNHGFTNVGMYPKRRSELPPLESDSDSDDDDEQSKGNNLNCAILNDSFLLSPCRSEQDEKSNPGQNANDTDNLSFLAQFHNMALNSVSKPSTVKELSENLPLKPLQMLEDRVDGRRKSSNLQRTQNDPPPQELIDLETPLKSNAKPIVNSSSASVNTDAQFATPQIRSFSVQRRPRELCISTSQKSRAAIAREFRSQKVLFQTPMTIQRPHKPNDTLAISLCDTIPEGADVSSSAEKSPCGTASHHGGVGGEKSKKSLDAVFQEAEQNQKENEKPKQMEKCTISANPSLTNSNRDSILNINDYEYEIISKLGAGGSSSVYFARRKDNGIACALKVVDLQGEPLIVEGYLNETKLLAKLQGNPCVVSLYDYQLLQKESRLFMIMEKGDSDLQKILQTYTTNLPLYVLMNFLYQMIQAVNYIHQNGVIHSDLKPANFLMVNGRLKLIDFGIASNIALDSTSIIKFSQAGTFNYISPEALTDTSTGTSPMRNQPKIKISTKSDVWSLGCILYLFLYKKTPFSHIKNIYAKISAISNPSTAIDYPPIPPYYPIMLVHMVKNCLQHNPKQRPSCADLLKYPFQMVIPIQNLSIANKT